MYNCSHPPSYNLSSVTAPVAFYFAQNDILAHPDVSYCNRLFFNLKCIKKVIHSTPIFFGILFLKYLIFLKFRIEL